MDNLGALSRPKIRFMYRVLCIAAIRTLTIALPTDTPAMLTHDAIWHLQIIERFYRKKRHFVAAYLVYRIRWECEASMSVNGVKRNLVTLLAQG